MRWGWVGTGMWAVVDQGLFAGANFALNLILARWLGPEDYGVFGVAFAIFIFTTLVLTALINEPLLVLGTKHVSTFRHYLKGLSLAQLMYSAAAAIVLLLVSLVVSRLPDGAGLSRAVLTACWAGPIITISWTARRVMYVVGRPQIAAWGSALYLVVLLVVVLLVNRVHAVDAQWAFSAMAIAGALSGLFLIWCLHAILPADEPVNVNSSIPGVLKAHWQFGRWLLASSILGWVANDLIYLLLTPAQGFAAAGTLRAANNLIMPMLHAQGALGAIAVPWLVREMSGKRDSRLLFLWWFGLTSLSAAYTLLLIVFSGPAIEFVYGSEFSDLEPILRVIALIPVTAATGVALSAILKAQMRTREHFVASLVSAVATLSLGLLLIGYHGLMGAAIALIAASALASGALALQLLGLPQCGRKRMSL